MPPVDLGHLGPLLGRNQNASSSSSLIRACGPRAQIDGGGGLPRDLGEPGQDGRTRVDQRLEVGRLVTLPPRLELLDAAILPRDVRAYVPSGGPYDLGNPAGLLLAKPAAWQDEPWEGDVVARSAAIFRLLRVRRGPSVGLKCGASREAADEWLLRYPDDACVMR